MANIGIDAYEKLKNRFGSDIIQQIFDFGLEEIIYPDQENVLKSWACLRERVLYKKNVIASFVEKMILL